MVHNAIEYVDMQLIAETYWLMKMGLKMDNDAMAKVFAKWNKGKLNSYLIEIEPMLVGLAASIMIHAIGLLLKFISLPQR